MTFKLPDLPYDNNALEPVIDTRTMAIHHDKHHAGYVANLNKALADYPDLQDYSAVGLLINLDKIPEAIRTAVRNNGGGHVNHSMFWQSMTPKKGSGPSGSLAESIDEAFGSFPEFQAAFKQAALGRFGSGWAWLAVDPEGQLTVTSTANQDNPILSGQIPLLGLDVWEHAYYLNYQNRRTDYIDSWWAVVNWDNVAANYSMVRAGAKLDDLASWASEKWSKLENAWTKLSGAGD